MGRRRRGPGWTLCGPAQLPRAPVATHAAAGRLPGHLVRMTATPWHLRGHVVLACNCDFGCPCNFNALPTPGKCEGHWNWHVEEGSYGDTSLAGLTFSLA